VRNACDHGIESTEDMVTNGKDCGRISMSYREEQDWAVLTLAENGRGIDGERCAQKALEKGLLTAEQVAALSESQKQELIFLPGLSTKDEVSETSGRGVGMDAVKAESERWGGKAHPHSQKGNSTRIKLKLPLVLSESCLLEEPLRKAS
jgi:two-component system chemotaxis sensor kinase CheA